MRTRAPSFPASPTANRRKRNWPARAELAREVQPRIRAARKAAPKSKGAVKDLQAVYKLMKPHVANLRKRFLKRVGHNQYAKAFAGMFNELLTVGAMHGIKFREKYFAGPP